MCNHFGEDRNRKSAKNRAWMFRSVRNDRRGFLRENYFGLLKGGGCLRCRRFHRVFRSENDGWSAKRGRKTGMLYFPFKKSCIMQNDYLLKWLWIDNTSGISLEYSTLVFPERKTKNDAGTKQLTNRHTVYCTVCGEIQVTYFCLFLKEINWRPVASVSSSWSIPRYLWVCASPGR